MVDACIATLSIDGEGEVLEAQTNQGTLVGSETTYTFVPLTDTAALTQATFQFLCDINSLTQQKELDLTTVLITKAEVEIFQEISSLNEALGKLEVPENHQAQGQPQKVDISLKQQLNHPLLTTASSSKQMQNAESAQKFSSLFSLARALSPQMARPEMQNNRSEAPTRRESTGETMQLQKEYAPKPEEKRFKEKDQEQGSSQDQKRDHEEQEKKNKKKIQISNIQTSRSSKTSVSVSSSSETNTSSSGSDKTPEMGNIFMRFMALMARILGQAEAEAHSLYLRIKERTDNIETLTKLASKINSESGKIDWTKDEEMKALVERARELGVEIPEGKFKWTEEEKKLLKENIQMRKDNLEKITQLERTDMQRYLQEATHCHQARSNILKLLKEVIDTFIHNIRPG